MLRQCILECYAICVMYLCTHLHYLFGRGRKLGACSQVCMGEAGMIDLLRSFKCLQHSSLLKLAHFISTHEIMRRFDYREHDETLVDDYDR